MNLVLYEIFQFFIYEDKLKLILLVQSFNIEIGIQLALLLTRLVRFAFDQIQFLLARELQMFQYYCRFKPKIRTAEI